MRFYNFIILFLLSTNLVQAEMKTHKLTAGSNLECTENRKILLEGENIFNIYSSFNFFQEDCSEFLTSAKEHRALYTDTDALDDTLNGLITLNEAERLVFKYKVGNVIIIFNNGELPKTPDELEWKHDPSAIVPMSFPLPMAYVLKEKSTTQFTTHPNDALYFAIKILDYTLLVDETGARIPANDYRYITFASMIQNGKEISYAGSITSAKITERSIKEGVQCESISDEELSCSFFVIESDTELDAEDDMGFESVFQVVIKIVNEKTVSAEYKLISG